MNVKLTEMAQQEREWFEAIFLPRSRQKWDQGIRTQERHISPAEWKWFVRQYGRDLLVSCYDSACYCVVTTPGLQLGMLTDELPDFIQAALKGSPRNPLAVSVGQETEEPYEPISALTEQQLVGLKGECWGDKKTGRIGMAVPPLGIQPDSVQWEIVEVTAAIGKTPAWADLVAGKLRIRINPDICQPPFWRLSDCVWIAGVLWKTLPTGNNWTKISLPPEPHPHSQAFVFQRCIFPAGVEGVLIDTFERCKQHQEQACIRDGQHRTKSR